MNIDKLTRANEIVKEINIIKANLRDIDNFREKFDRRDIRVDVTDDKTMSRFTAVLGYLPAIRTVSLIESELQKRLDEIEKEFANL